MNKLIVIAILALSHAAFASNGNIFDVKLDVKNKSTNSSNHVLVTPGKSSSVYNKSNGLDQFIDVDAQVSKTHPELIELKITVGTLDREGVRNVVSTHEIVTKNNETREITTPATKDGEATIIVVSPTRRTL